MTDLYQEGQKLEDCRLLCYIPTLMTYDDSMKS